MLLLFCKILYKKQPSESWKIRPELYCLLPICCLPPSGVCLLRFKVNFAIYSGLYCSPGADQGAFSAADEMFSFLYCSDVLYRIDYLFLFKVNLGDMVFK